MKSALICCLLAFWFAGCASSGVVEMSPNHYLITKRSGAGMFANVSGMKAEVIREAAAFAERKGKHVEPIHLGDTVPTHGFPSVDYQFRLVDKTNNAATPAKP